MLWFKLRKLRSRNFNKRNHAFAEAIHQRNVEALLQVVDDNDSYLRSDAISALGEIGDSSAVPALVMRLDDANFNNQEQAAAALAKIGDSRAIRPLVAVLRNVDKHEEVRHAAKSALADIGDSKAVPDLIEALHADDARSRKFALQVLASIGDARSVPAVIATLCDRNTDVRWAAVEALGSLGDPRATEPLIALLSREPASGQCHELVIEALGRIGDIRAKETLENFLNAPQAALRRAAGRALMAIGSESDDEESRVRYTIAEWNWSELVRLKWEYVRGPLLKILQNGDVELKREAVKALRLINQADAMTLLILALKDQKIASEVATLLGDSGEPAAISSLVEYSLSYRPEGDYWNNPNAPYNERARAEMWLQPLTTLLQKSADRASVEELVTITNLQDKTFDLCVNYNTPGYGDGADNFTIALDFSAIRTLAREELRRRACKS